MTTLVGIRTHTWGEDQARLFAQLEPVFGSAVRIVFHGRPDGMALPAPVVDLSDGRLEDLGLRPVPDWGWRCGDYALHALRAAAPDADHYWMIEPDVWFSGNPAAFFGQTDALTQDLLGVRIEPLRPDHRFTRGLAGIAPHRTIFALIRLSGRAIDRLLPLRQAYGRSGVGARFFSNDEVFVTSSILADPDLTSASLADLMPDWFPEGSMRTDPDILLETLDSAAGQGVFHPVRGRASFRRAVAVRLAQNAGFLAAMRESLSRLTDEELTGIAAEAAIELARNLRLAARPGGAGEA
jgi:hypothetical protein